jgi:hypothetical protein
MAKKKQSWERGDIFLIKTEGSFNIVGQIIGHEPQAMNSVGVALFDERISNTTNTDFIKLNPDSIFSILLVTRDLLDLGVWKVICNRPVTLPKETLPYESLRSASFVGAKIRGSAIVNEFVNAYCGLMPWDDFHDPKYLDNLLISPSKKPSNLVFKKG